MPLRLRAGQDRLTVTAVVVATPTGLVLDRVGPSVDVRCDVCGDTFALSPRNEYRHRMVGTRPRCRVCRWPQKVKLTEAERERFRLWWLEESGLSLAELREIAVGLGG